MASVTIQAVKKNFGDVPILHGVDIDIKDGSFTVLVGPSGCGKSTLLRMIAGLEQINSGEIRIGERRVNDLPPKERDIAMVFQNYALYPHMTVRKNMAFALSLAKMKEADIDAKVNRAAEILGLMPLLERYPRQLSGGQRQRVAMGRAMIRKPKVFLYDEPLSNLDLELRVRLRPEIARMQRALKSTAVYVTHDQTEAMTLADQIVVLRKGRIEQVGAPLTLYRSPANLFVAGFIGTPRINLFDVSANVEDGAGTSLMLKAATVKVPQHLPRAAATLGFRPEHARLGEADPGEVQFELQDCETQAVEHLGDRTFCYLRSSLGELVVLAPDAQAQVSGTVRLAVRAEALHFFDAQEQAMRAP
ncbi:MAG: sn-glycerol-3-phosphate ABC transporter ATP-binding protein UgpC [Burkholderiaceae bacterium]|nr:sn-glycerol-3-phosphate ABC transporter ATP-binding protein UgpC [Burkholderiaceae bacterium]